MSWGNKGNDNGPWGKPRNTGGGNQGGQNGGGSNGGGKGPSSGNDFDDLFRKGQDHFKDMFGGNNGDADNKKATLLILVIAAFMWLGSGFYVVDTDEQGLVLRFGEYHRTEMPGLHYHMPWPVERVFTPSVTNINKEEVGLKSVSRFGSNTSQNEGQMLTGDLNIVDVNFTVQWKIDSTKTDHFLFNMREAELMVKPVAESAMREVIGQMSLGKILTVGQTEIANRSRDIMQQMVDTYKAGIQIVGVNLNKPDVPAEVIDAFQDIKRAEQEKNTLINRAEAYNNEIIPKARGKAVQAEQDALAYKREVTERATGDVARFLSVYEEYKQARDVTKKRIYLETMEEIFKGMNKFIIDDKGGKGVLPYLPMNELNRSKGERS